MLGAQHNPFQTGGDPNPPEFSVRNLDLVPGMTLRRLEDRRALHTHFDTARRRFDGLAESAAIDRFQREAFAFVSGPEMPSVLHCPRISRSKGRFLLSDVPRNPAASTHPSRRGRASQ